MGIFNTRDENDAEAGGECGRQEAKYRENHLFTGPIYDGAGNFISALSGPEFERARQAAKNGEKYVPPTNEEDDSEDEEESEDSSPNDYLSHGGGGSFSDDRSVIPKNGGCWEALSGCLAIVLLLGGMVTGAFYGVTSCAHYVQKLSRELDAKNSGKPQYEMRDQVIESDKEEERLRKLRLETPARREEPHRKICKSSSRNFQKSKS